MRDPSSPVVSVRYYPKDVPFREPGDPGLEAPPVGRPYEKVVKTEDGYTTCSLHDYHLFGVTKPEPARAGAQAIAEKFADAQAEAFLYRPSEKAWRVWDGAVWRRDLEGRVREKIREAVEAALAEGGGRRGGAQGPTNMARLVAAVERLARDRLAVTEDFDAEPMRLATPGGIVDLATGTLRPADPRERITRTTAVAPAPGADCPLWRRFLDEAMGGDAARVAFLQRFLGYALTGETRDAVRPRRRRQRQERARQQCARHFGRLRRRRRAGFLGPRQA